MEAAWMENWSKRGLVSRKFTQELLEINCEISMNIFWQWNSLMIWSQTQTPKHKKLVKNVTFHSCIIYDEFFIVHMKHKLCGKEVQEQNLHHDFLNWFFFLVNQQSRFVFVNIHHKTFKIYFVTSELGEIWGCFNGFKVVLIMFKMQKMFAERSLRLRFNFLTFKTRNCWS